MTFLLQALCATLVLLAGGLAHAHGGYENETEVQLYPDRMRIVTRTSIPFAWKLLGDRAPGTLDEAGQAAAKPLLAEAARDLFEVTAGGDPMTPVKSDCVFEVHDLHDHAAFTIDFARPTAWPVTLKATFSPRLGELDEGSIAVFDHTASRFSRDVEPLAKKSIRKADPAVTFDLTGKKPTEAPTAANSAPAPVTPAKAADAPDRQRLLPLLLLLGVLLAGVLTLVIRKHSRAAG